jgi:membrane-bound serine protease (ClpP class)
MPDYNSAPRFHLRAARRGTYPLAMAVVITLLVAGFLLLVLETVLPGMVAGIAGLIALFAGVVEAYLKLGVEAGNLVLLGVMAALTVGTVFWFRFFPQSRIGRLFVSKGAVGELGLKNESLVEQMGVAHTNLRPSGIAIIGGKRVDVVTEGGMIEPGTPVRVVSVEGLRVVVRAERGNNT